MNDFFAGLELSMGLLDILVCSVYLWNTLVYIKKGSNAIHYYFYLIYYFFFIFPVILMILVPNYKYKIFWRANDAMEDPISNIIYYIFTMFFSVCIIHSSRMSREVKVKNFTYNRLAINTCTAVIIFVFLITIMRNGIGILTSGYGVHYTKGIYEINEPLIGCGIMCFLILLGYSEYVSKFRIWICSFIIIAFFSFVGKRYIIAETLILCVYVLSMTGKLQGRKFIKCLFLVASGVLGLCVAYGIVIKGNFTGIVDYLAVDFSRQYTLVYQIFSKNIERQISIYKWDAIIYILAWWIPRVLWPTKPYGFVNQLTISLTSEMDPILKNMGWATTCSIFSDLFDSFSYIGLLMGILIFVWILDKANKTSKPHQKIFLMYLSIKLVTVQISSWIIQIVLCFLMFSFCDVFGKKRSKMREK